MTIAIAEATIKLKIANFPGKIDVVPPTIPRKITGMDKYQCLLNLDCSKY